MSAARARRSASAAAKAEKAEQHPATRADEPESAARRLEKSPSAFRTISEVADELDVPQHVLRFWESKFPQVRPLKRGGGRRYYRPEDVDLLGRIRQLLYQDGYTIKGVQRLMREGALKAKRDAAPSGEAPADAGVEAAMTAGAEEREGAAGTAVSAPDRAELEALLSELVTLREGLRRFAG